MLTVYPGTAACNHVGTAESFDSDAQAASSRQGAAAADAAGDRYAVDWSGSIARFLIDYSDSSVLHRLFSFLSHLTQQVMHVPVGVDWNVNAYEDDSTSESTSQRSPLRSPSATSMAPMGDDAGVIFAALSQRLRREQSKSQALQRELQVLRSSEAMTFDIQVCPLSYLNLYALMSCTHIF